MLHIGSTFLLGRFRATSCVGSSLPTPIRTKTTPRKATGRTRLRPWFKQGVPLRPDGPNWVHQRMFVQYNLKSLKNGMTRSLRARNRHHWKRCKELRGNPETSCSCRSSSCRPLHWDRSGLYVSERVNYVEDTRALMEVLVGFLVLDDTSQGVDTTASLLDK
ncbi:hypothetical protein LXA43DRAFT_568534 [Ganoderma leucocontextum]|nr:hypothetical protein LXA43DRAFT_568534 [Ganoderma leucocontextum]